MCVCVCKGGPQANHSPNRSQSVECQTMSLSFHTVEGSGLVGSTFVVHGGELDSGEYTFQVEVATAETSEVGTQSVVVSNGAIVAVLMIPWTLDESLSAEFSLSPYALVQNSGLQEGRSLIKHGVCEQRILGGGCLAYLNHWKDLFVRTRADPEPESSEREDEEEGHVKNECRWSSPRGLRCA